MPAAAGCLILPENHAERTGYTHGKSRQISAISHGKKFGQRDYVDPINDHQCPNFPAGVLQRGKSV